MKRRSVNPGEKFDKVEVIQEIIQDGGRRRFLCRCICGNKCIKTLSDLVSKKTNSCGCWRKTFRLKHGATVTKPGGKLAHRGTPEYNAWTGLKQRCMNPNNLRYKDYGGRGIDVSPVWLTNFPQFLLDVGFKPSPKHSLDRIDNSKGYEPGNVRWALPVQQQRNMRSNVLSLEAVREIRKLKGKMSGRKVAKLFQVWSSTIYGIWSGRLWYEEED